MTLSDSFYDTSNCSSAAGEAEVPGVIIEGAEDSNITDAAAPDAPAVEPISRSDILKSIEEKIRERNLAVLTEFSK